MLKLTYETKEPRTQAIFDFENKFVNKIKIAKNLSNYNVIKMYAQNCIHWHTGCGFISIQATAIMNKFINMTNNEFIEWVKTVN